MRRRGSNPDLSGDPLDLARRAAIHLYQTDPEFVRGGCSDISEIISELLRRQGYRAKAVYGLARKGRAEPFAHAWVDIDGQLFDPVIWTQDSHPEKFRYKISPDVREVIKCDIETILEGEVEELEKRLLGSRP